MLPLDKGHLGRFEAAIKDAREIAEAGALAALQQLGVGESQPYDFLSEGDRKLRRRLRAHGRMLGDLLHPNDTQEIQRLSEEVGYEHWHRMLFARFLAENNLLMFPDPENPVAVTIEECQELAADEGAKNAWDLASKFAAKMLPQIFRPESPIFQIQLPPEYHQKLEKLVEGLPGEIFSASDSLGWAYQFWQTKRKQEVDLQVARGGNVGAREISPVTQLFTEPYMVSFVLDNTIGAWWAEKKLSKDDLRFAASEADLRKKIALPNQPFTFLRFIRDEDGWKIASSPFRNWPESLKDFQLLDPCCGSGHFLVASFLLLVPMRMALEGLTAMDAVDAVLRENIHALEIDQRCVELAAFGLALSAWRFPGTGGYRKLPTFHIACSGLTFQSSKGNREKLSCGNANLSILMEELAKEFRNAATLGSLINPEKTKVRNLLVGVSEEAFDNAFQLFLKGEKDNFDLEELGIMAQGVAESAKLLCQKFHLIVTNVPFKGSKKLDSILNDFFEENYPLGKANLATAFILRIRDWLRPDGTAAFVTPHEWLFLTSYKHLRKHLLDSVKWEFLADLGEHAFNSSQAAGAFTALISFSKTPPDSDSKFLGIDCNLLKNPDAKRENLTDGPIYQFLQTRQKENPDYRFGLFQQSEDLTMITYAKSHGGMQNGDAPRYLFYFWEIPQLNPQWELFLLPCNETRDFGGREGIIRWEKGNGAIAVSPQAHLNGMKAWGKHGVAIRQTRSLPATLYTGEMFDQSCIVLIPNDEKGLSAIWAFCSSKEFHDTVRKIDKKKNVTYATIDKISFNPKKWEAIAERDLKNGLPKPSSSDPTQWIFHGHPAHTAEVLQVAVAKILGYQWPAELDPAMELSATQRKIIADACRLQKHIDADGILCIPAVRGENQGAERILNLLVDAFGKLWTNDTLPDLLQKADHTGKTLETWLRDKFFAQHCRLFGQRPFIWQVWDGLPDGFSALLNYHKLDKKNMETLIYTYIGDWIQRQKQDRDNHVDGAEVKLVAAELLKNRLELILEGESPHDIFVRWKAISEQPVGWDPDINDGVRVNIRPFLTVQGNGRKGAGILRDKPNIDWKKDRGKESDDSPTFSLLKGERVNDYHLSLSQKRPINK
ncbi:MAG: N-6 DNA methylase [Candidatus Riflebacteria bacterium]|nr:N-6 DNA methylase [Candidatus Riflebacteria bacterium]